MNVNFYKHSKYILLTRQVKFPLFVFARWQEWRFLKSKAKQSTRSLDEGAGRSLYALQIT